MIVLKVLKIGGGIVLIISAVLCIIYTNEKELKEYNDGNFNIRYYGDSVFLLLIALILFITANV